MGDRIKAWLLSLDYPQRRALAGIGALVVVLGLVVGIAALTGDDGGDDPVALQTDDDGSSTSTTDPDDATSSNTSIDLVDGSSSTSSSSTSTTKRTTTTKKGGTSTTKKPTTGTTKGGGGGSGGGTGGASSTTATTQATSTTSGATPDGPSASTVAGLYGARRDEQGKPRLTRTGELNQVAASWAAHLAAQGANGTLSHQPMANVQAKCSRTCEGAENVARHQSASGAWSVWLNSPDHRNNIDDPRCGEYGLAAYAIGGDIYFVHVFGFFPTCP